MTKVKNIDGFIEKKAVCSCYCTCCHISSCSHKGFNLARNIIGELDITFDVVEMEKILEKHLLPWRSAQIKTIATALAKGNIIKGVSK